MVSFGNLGDNDMIHAKHYRQASNMKQLRQAMLQLHLSDQKIIVC